jgi:PAS domain S-box-containing protein
LATNIDGGAIIGHALGDLGDPMRGLYRQLRQRFLVWRARWRSTQASPHRSREGDSEVGDEGDHARAIAEHAQAMLDSALDAIIVMDGDGKVVEWNAAAERTFKYTRAQAVGRQMAELIIPEALRQKHRDGLAHYLRTGEASILGRRIEMRARRADGGEFPVELTVVRVGAGGKPLFTGFIRDLSERRHAEEALRISEERFRLLAEGSTDIVYRFRLQPAPGFEYVSPAATNVLGYTPEEHYADPDIIYKVIHPADRERLEALVGKGTEGQPVELRWVRKDGAIVCVEHRDTPLRDHEGNIVAVHGIGRDVTERRRAESEQELLAELGVVFAGTLDIDETVTGVARTINGMLADCSIVDLFVGEKRPRVVKVSHADPSRMGTAEAIQRILLEGSRSQRYRQADEGDRRAVLLSDVPSTVSNLPETFATHLGLLKELVPISYIGLPLIARGRLLGALSLVSSDPRRRYAARELKVAQEVAYRTSLAIETAELHRAAQQAVQARDDLLSIVAHDLRSPLTAAKLAAAEINRKTDDAAAVRRSADRIDRSIDRANGLIQDLLDVSRIEAGSLAVERGRVAARELVGDTADIFAPMASAASLRLMIEAPEHLPEVLADSNRVRQVFSNIVGNAIKFTPAGGTIRLAATRHDSEVCFQIADTGPGILPEQLPHLFDRFWQARQGDRRGAGLGLPIAKGIVEAHGGRLWIDTAPGRGSTFYFTLPVAPAPVELADEQAPLAPSS